MNLLLMRMSSRVELIVNTYNNQKSSGIEPLVFVGRSWGRYTYQNSTLRVVFKRYGNVDFINRIYSSKSRSENLYTLTDIVDYIKEFKEIARDVMDIPPVNTNLTKLIDHILLQLNQCIVSNHSFKLALDDPGAIDADGDGSVIIAKYIGEQSVIEKVVINICYNSSNNKLTVEVRQKCDCPINGTVEKPMYRKIFDLDQVAVGVNWIKLPFIKPILIIVTNYVLAATENDKERELFSFESKFVAVNAKGLARLAKYKR